MRASPLPCLSRTSQQGRYRSFLSLATGQQTQRFGNQDNSMSGPSQAASSKYRVQKRKTPRLRLSCSKCKERKVRCDRTQPCSACCARGLPRECVFDCEGEHGPISQSDEIRRLRKENERLRAMISDAKPVHQSRIVKHESIRKSAKASTLQVKFQPGCNVYFGSPSLAEVVADFANAQVGQSLTHTLGSRDLYTPSQGALAYPFPILGEGSAVEMVENLLNDHALVFRYLDMFQCRAQALYFPHHSEEKTRTDFARFLQDARSNGEKSPDMLAVIFTTMAIGLQVGVWDTCGGRWDAAAVESARMSSSVYVAAAMQSLRLASFMNTPTLLVIQTLVMLGPYLTNTGRFLDSWTLFGATIRTAQAIGLHRDPELLRPVPDEEEAALRRSLWWWIMHMDQQYSVISGRPLGISGIGDCPAPEPLLSNPVELRLGAFTHHFTVLARQVLSSDGMTSVSKIDEFTDKLVGLWETMPIALRFSASWLSDDATLPDWPLAVVSCNLFAEVHSFIILLNQHRTNLSLSDDYGSQSTPSARRRETPRQSPAGKRKAGALSEGSAVPRTDMRRGKDLVLESSKQLLYLFLFLHRRQPAVLISWPLTQHVLSACQILLLDAVETHRRDNEWLLQQACSVMQELRDGGVHELAVVACEQIGRGLAQLRALPQPYETDPQERSAGQHVHERSSGIGEGSLFASSDQKHAASTPAGFRPMRWFMTEASQLAENPSRAQQSAGVFDSTGVVPSPSSTFVPHLSTEPGSQQARTVFF